MSQWGRIKMTHLKKPCRFDAWPFSLIPVLTKIVVNVNPIFAEKRESYWTGLISLEEVSCVYFALYIVQLVAVTVSDDGMTSFLEFIKIINNFATKEC